MTRDVKVSRPAWSRDHIFGLGLGLGLIVVGLGLGLGLMGGGLEVSSRWLTPKSKSSYLASTSKVISKFLCIWSTINVVSNL